MTRRTSYLLLFVAGCVLLGCMGLTIPIEIVFFLGAGWLFFVSRVSPEITVDWGSLAMGTVCLLLFAGLTHWFCGWLYGTIAPEERPKWKALWTASLVTGVVLMFSAGISATGMVHQLGWLLTSKEPWFSNGGGSYSAARRAQSVNNLKQIGLAILNYHEKEGTMPPGATVDAEGQLLHGWQARLLPYMEQQELFDRIDFTVPWDHPRNADAYRTRVNFLLNPGISDVPDPNLPAPSHYSGNVRLLGGDSARKMDEITDGTSNTILAGEVPGDFKPWGHPANWRDPAKGINGSPDGFGGPFRGGANFLMADGSVRFLKDTIDPKVLRALGTPNGGEAINSDEY